MSPSQASRSASSTAGAVLRTQMRYVTSSDEFPARSTLRTLRNTIPARDGANCTEAGPPSVDAATYWYDSPSP